MAFDPISVVLGIGEKVIDRVWPDPEEKARAKLELMKLHQNGEFRDLETRMSAIIAEAKSDDPWTSRARPSFLYVIYLMILAAIPMGILSAVNPAMAQAVSAGMQAWLGAIPDGLWATFAAGYLGYAGARSFDKKKVMDGLKGGK